MRTRWRAETPRESRDQRLSVLLLCDDNPGHANTVLDHIQALTSCSSHDVRIFNPCGMERSRYLDLGEFDVVVLHYSLVIISDHYLAPAFRDQIRRFQGLKVLFLQDEYRWVNASAAMMQYLGIDILFTLLQSDGIAAVYGDRGLARVQIVSTLAGYVPEALVGHPVPPLEERPIELGYRGRTLPYWLGRLGQEKSWIAQGVTARAHKYNLRCDIGWKEEDRIYGQAWIKFIASCRATLGTESGASITDFDGMIERRTKAYLAAAPTATFEEVARDVLGASEGMVPVTAVSPRVFEAAALRTALVLFPGEYSGLIKPWEHYIPLNKDFSNMDDVVTKLRDLSFLRSMTERTHRDLVASGRFSQRALAEAFDEVLWKFGTTRSRPRKLYYRLATLERPCTVAISETRRKMQPWLLMPQNVFKGMLAAWLLVRSPVGRMLLEAILKDASLRAIGLSNLARDILKLAVVGQALSCEPMKRPFDVRIDFISEGASLILESQTASAKKSPASLPTASDSGAPHIRSLVWNHSAVGGTVSYVLAACVRIPVCVGDYDLHSFEGFVRLMSQKPKLGWDLFRSLTKICIEPPRTV